MCNFWDVIMLCLSTGWPCIRWWRHMRQGAAASQTTPRCCYAHGPVHMCRWEWYLQAPLFNIALPGRALAPAAGAAALNGANGHFFVVTSTWPTTPVAHLPAAVTQLSNGQLQTARKGVRSDCLHILTSRYARDPAHTRWSTRVTTGTQRTAPQGQAEDGPVAQ
jgi:hypothetical protein